MTTTGDADQADDDATTGEAGKNLLGVGTSIRATRFVSLPDAANGTKPPEKSPLPGQEPPVDMFGQAGLDLWVAITSEFVLGPHERTLLIEACRCADDLDLMSVQIGLDGMLLPWGRGGQRRAHPLLSKQAETRAQLARLIASLHIPAEETEGTAVVRRRQFRAYRGRA